MNISTHLLGQTIGIIGFIICLCGFSQKREFRMKILLGLSATFASGSYFILGSFAGAYAIGISAARNFISITKWGKKLLPLFIILYLISSYLTYKKSYDILPLIGALTSTFSMLCFKNLKLRYGMIISCSIWLTYNIITFSIGPILMEIFNIIASIITIIRIKKDNT
jgi:hypothetical protein